MREAAEPAEAGGGLFEIEEGESVGIGAVRPHAEAFEEGAADQMRRLAGHRADPEIDAGFAKIHRQQLRMGVGHVQDAGIAEAFEIVDACRVGAAREARQAPGERRGAREGDKFPAADGHAMSPRLQEEFSGFPYLSKVSFRWWPGRSTPLPRLRPRSMMLLPCRSRRPRRPFSLPQWQPPSRSIDCAGRRPPCWRLPPRPAPSCSRPRWRRARR